jgi:VanZ family protein
MSEHTTPRPIRLVRVIWVCYAIALMIATHIPIPEDFGTFVSVYDKLLHAGAYLGLGVLTYLSLMDFRTGTLAVLPVYVGLLLFAAQDEYLQGFVNRTPDFNDWVSDALATLVALCGLRFLMPRLHGSCVATAGLQSQRGPTAPE